MTRTGWLVGLVALLVSCESADDDDDTGGPPRCGDARCSPGESCESCAADCACVCGDGACSASVCETCARCPADCGACVDAACTCGDGVCDNYYCGEGCVGCAADCGACETCGDAACSRLNEDLNTCPEDCGRIGSCGDGICDLQGAFGESAQTCPEDCAGRYCGDGICQQPYFGDVGGEIGVCPGDCPSTCGDGICGLGPAGQCAVEDCPADCPAGTGVCGDGVCQQESGESCDGCPGDCGACPTCGDGHCQSTEICAAAGPAENCERCPTDCGTCANRACGNGTCDGELGEECVGCPGDCGVCPSREVVCGDGVCGFEENCVACEDDCGPCAVCGDGVCANWYAGFDDGPAPWNAPLLETWESCPDDCGGGGRPLTFAAGDDRCEPGDGWSADCDDTTSCGQACATSCDCQQPWTVCGPEIGGARNACTPLPCSACFDGGQGCAYETPSCLNTSCQP